MPVVTDRTDKHLCQFVLEDRVVIDGGCCETCDLLSGPVINETKLKMLLT